jgi:hypothetical protein
MGDNGREGTLGFERAEYAPGEAPAVPSCGFCSQRIASVYFQIDDAVACPRCRTTIVQKREAGSGFGRLVRAGLYGSLAGAAGAVLWYGVRTLTGYEVGLIGLAVGLMVGAAVRAGSGGRGGWRYQGLAMALTYVSIVSTYVPMIVTGVVQATKQEAAAPEKAPATPGTPSEATPVGAAAVSPAAAEPRSMPAAAGRLALAVALFAALVFAIAMAVPFLGGLQNVIGLVIIAIALYEAWKMNRHVPLVVTGPHRVGKALDTPARG